DRETNWHLRPTSFGPINLLVGVSGVGKSRTLQALNRVARCGVGLTSAPTNAQWKLRLNASGRTFDWEVETGSAEEGTARFAIDSEFFAVVESSSSARKTNFVAERLISQDGDIIASRNGDAVTLNNLPALKLKETESLISLFQKEERIAPLFENLSHVFASSVAEFEFPYWPRRLVKQWQKDITNLEQLRKAMRCPLIVRFDLLRTLAPGEFDAIISSFAEIFDTVKTVRVGWARELLNTNVDEDDDRLMVIIEEEGVNTPIRLPDLSSGMRRTLRHLVELALAPSGSTILIDEYENSLGVNCLPSITRHLLNRTRDIQLIATSHHPYVINNIALEHWRVVARQGSEVEIVEAAAIPELQTASRQEAFIRLMNSETYRHGVSNS
ncbi:MAG TPA: ATP-binding protein, partial [Polyangium sp.]|nr:ATP-binding protein [Polyangium sp.]